MFDALMYDISITVDVDGVLEQHEFSTTEATLAIDVKTIIRQIMRETPQAFFAGMTFHHPPLETTAVD